MGGWTTLSLDEIVVVSGIDERQIEKKSWTGYLEQGARAAQEGARTSTGSYASR